MTHLDINPYIGFGRKVNYVSYGEHMSGTIVGVLRNQDGDAKSFIVSDDEGNRRIVNRRNVMA